MNIRRMFANPPKRNYATAEAAFAAAEAVLAEYSDESDESVMSCVIASGTDEKGRTRFFPVFLPAANQVSDAIGFAHSGFCVARV